MFVLRWSLRKITLISIKSYIFVKYCIPLFNANIDNIWKWFYVIYVKHVIKWFISFRIQTSRSNLHGPFLHHRFLHNSHSLQRYGSNPVSPQFELWRFPATNGDEMDYNWYCFVSVWRGCLEICATTTSGMICWTWMMSSEFTTSEFGKTIFWRVWNVLPSLMHKNWTYTKLSSSSYSTLIFVIFLNRLRHVHKTKFLYRKSLVHLVRTCLLVTLDFLFEKRV